MPAAFEIVIKDEEVKKFFKSGRLVRAINKHATRQLLGFGTEVKAEIRRTLRSGIPGSPLGVQQYIKGNGKLLVHSGRFLNSVSFKYKSETAMIRGIEVGWHKGSTNKGYPYSKLIEIFEHGRTWKPSDGERQAVALRAKAAGAPVPSGSRKETWTIPARPFLGNIQNSPKLQSKFMALGEKILKRAVDELTR